MRFGLLAKFAKARGDGLSHIIEVLGLASYMVAGQIVNLNLRGHAAPAGGGIGGIAQIRFLGAQQNNASEKGLGPVVHQDAAVSEVGNTLRRIMGLSWR